MKMNLSTVTEMEIREIAERVSKEVTTPIMYLHNNGEKDFRWKLDNIAPWFQEDITD